MRSSWLPIVYCACIVVTCFWLITINIEFIESLNYICQKSVFVKQHNCVFLR